MNRKPHILLIPCILLMLLFTQSCENEIPYNGDKNAPKLTMNAFIYIDSLTNRLYLSMTGETAIQPVGSCVVEIHVNDELKETLNATRKETSQLSTVDITTRFQPGDVVRIDARTTDGTHHAWIQETVPHPVQIEQVDTIRVEVVPKPNYSTNKILRVKVHFKDRVGEKNYYRIMIAQRHQVHGQNSGQPKSYEFIEYGYWPWDDIALTDGRPATSEELDADFFERVTNYYGVFDDNWFRDKEYTLNVRIAVNNHHYIPSQLGFTPEYLNTDLIVHLLSITEIEFYYLTTMNMMDSDMFDDYINDPVRIPSNVKGGNGFVGISSESKKITRLVSNGKIQYTDSE